MINTNLLSIIKSTISEKKKITFMIGAGVSQDSGIPTFRGKEGYWVKGSKNYTPQEMATHSMFAREPEEVWKWYLYRKGIMSKANPNSNHYILADLENLLSDSFVLISQNIDGLHSRAGISEARTYNIHGNLNYVRCGRECTEELFGFPNVFDFSGRDINMITEHERSALKCPKCGHIVRPHVLWFDECYDENFYKIDTVISMAEQTGILFILGTSGATTLPQMVAQTVLRNGGNAVEVNIDRSLFSDTLDIHKNGHTFNMKSDIFLENLKKEIITILGESSN